MPVLSKVEGPVLSKVEGTTRLHIKNMVCPRCISAVRAILVSMKYVPISITLGEAEINVQLSDEGLKQLDEALRREGFELLDDPRAQLVEQIRIQVQEWVRMEGNRPKMSDYLCDNLGHDYSALSKLFSEVRGITIERFAVLHRIEYAKELLCYSQLSISEIAYTLDYSSPSHLSSQFKLVTGMTPKVFRELEHKSRKALNDI